MESQVHIWAKFVDPNQIIGQGQNHFSIKVNDVIRQNEALALLTLVMAIRRRKYRGFMGKTTIKLLVVYIHVSPGLL